VDCASNTLSYFSFVIIRLFYLEDTFEETEDPELGIWIKSPNRFDTRCLVHVRSSVTFDTRYDT
jgi:hypothetical protein